MRKVFLDDLPRWEKGEGCGNVGTVNWSKSIGFKIKFIYDDIEGEFEVLRCEVENGKERKMLLLKYNNEEGWINCGNFLKCKIGTLLNRYQSYKTNGFEIHNILKINEKGIVWDYIKSGEILKTTHSKYGYNEFEFIRYDRPRRRLYLKYKDEECNILTGGFCKGTIGALINKNTNNYKIEIGDTFIDEGRNLVVIDREYRKAAHGKSSVNDKWYRYECNQCGWNNGWIVEGHLLKNKRGCSCCNGKTVVIGINDIKTTAPWMIRLGVSKEDSVRHTKSSGRSIDVKCPDCGTHKNIKISDIFTNKSIGCRTCGDSVSFPEKFINNVLTQKNISFETQKVLFKSDSNKIRYDFYFEYKNRKYIVEVHGMQHYGNGFDTYGGRTLEEEIANDEYKKQSAIESGIDDYIVIDCRYSELEWIKNNVLESKLNELLDFSNLDWNKCEEYALSNVMKTICDFWDAKKGAETTKDLANKFNIDYSTVARYLKKGNSLGFCSYDPKGENKRIGKIQGDKMKEKLSIQTYIFKDDILLGGFSSTTDLERQSERLFGVKLDHRSISRVARGLQKEHKGFTFKYAE